MINTRTRRFFAAALAAICLALTACQGTNEHPLAYRDRLSSAVVSDGVRSFRITPIEGGFTVEITNPPSVSGITYRITGDTAFVSMGEAEIPVSDRMTKTVRQVIEFFTPSDDRLVGAKTDRKTGTCAVRFQTDEGEITANLSEDGIPTSFLTKDGTWTVEEYIQNPEI